MKGMCRRSEERLDKLPQCDYDAGNLCSVEGLFSNGKSLPGRLPRSLYCFGLGKYVSKVLFSTHHYDYVSCSIPIYCGA